MSDHRGYSQKLVDQAYKRGRADLKRELGIEATYDHMPREFQGTGSRWRLVVWCRDEDAARALAALAQTDDEK